MSILGPGYCDTCKWWNGERAHTTDYPYGTCHREPPRITKPMVLPYHDPDRPSEAGPMIERAEWPWTSFDDRCSQHETKTESEDTTP